MLTSELPKSSRVSGRACFNLPHQVRKLFLTPFSFRLFESRSSFEPPQTQGPTTFYGPGGKMTLCYPGFNNTMYCN